METYRYNRNCGCMRCRCRGITGPVVLMTVGTLFLLENLHIQDLTWGHTWPLLLIAIGVVQMLQRSASTEGHVQPFSGASGFPMPPAPPTSQASPMPEAPGSAIEVRHE